MSDNKVIFINIDSANGRSIEVKCDGQQTWWALSEEFLNFLKGMGFQVDHQQMADYFAEYNEPVSYDDDLYPISECTSEYEGPDVHYDFDEINIGDTITITLPEDKEDTK